MKISVIVKPNNKKPGIENLGEDTYIVKVRETATEGKANKAVIKAIAEKFNHPKSKIIILKGEKNKNKLIELEGL